MITVISGAQGSGKTLHAFELIEGKKSIFTNPRSLLHDLKNIEHDTEFIVVDELPIPLKPDMIAFIRTKIIHVRKPYCRDTEGFKRPDLILICQVPFRFERHFEKTIYIHFENIRL